MDTKLIQAIKGTRDVLPGQSSMYRSIENTLLEVASFYGFQEIRTPVFEATELFRRGVGDTTDIVQKEMYTFEDKGGRSITLRPEGTAGAARAFLEHGLFNEPLPQKVSYITNCYRYEKPQAGRYREFTQFGVEVYGTDSPAADAELIALANACFAHFEIKDVMLQINSIGCPHCRPSFHEALRSYFQEKKEELCLTCQDRLMRNPMRILDCKSPVCAAIAQNAPVGLEYLCEGCKTHFSQVQDYLIQMQIPYSINTGIVRGLDYYTKTVFEFVTDQIGAQGTICGGGRYDGLLQELGGNPMPALGFAMGIERLLLTLQAQEIPLPESDFCELFIVSIGQKASLLAAVLCDDLRASGIHAQFDIIGRSVKAQMKYADKIHAVHTMVLGDDDIEKQSCTVKNMQTKETKAYALDDFVDAFVENYYRKTTEMFYEALQTESFEPASD